MENINPNPPPLDPNQPTPSPNITNITFAILKLEQRLANRETFIIVVAQHYGFPPSLNTSTNEVVATKDQGFHSLFQEHQPHSFED